MKKIVKHYYQKNEKNEKTVTAWIRANFIFRRSRRWSKRDILEELLIR